MTLAHVIAGPLDIFIEIGLPVILFAALYWWSTRKKDKGEDR